MRSMATDISAFAIVYDRSERFLIVPDKGVDQVFTFTLDAASGELTQVDAGTPRARDGSEARWTIAARGRAGDHR